MISKNATEILEEWKSLARDYAAEIQRGDAKCRELQTEIERLRAEIDEIKQVEFPRRVQKVADAWRGKVDALQAKIEALEQQEPVAEWRPLDSGEDTRRD